MVLEPDGRRLLPAGWSPPAPSFQVTMVFERETGLGAVEAWLMPFLLDADGNVRLYVAGGLAGRPAAAPHLNRITIRPANVGVAVHLSTERDRSGQIVFSQVAQTAN